MGQLRVLQHGALDLINRLQHAAMACSGVNNVLANSNSYSKVAKLVKVVVLALGSGHCQEP